MQHWFFEKLKRIQALAKAGLNFSENVYDLERFEELHQLSLEMMAHLSDEKPEKLQLFYEGTTNYPTPKVDVRAVVFKEDKLLMVREKTDGLWSLPGGWADIGFSPSEVAVKEVQEESGLEVQSIRLLAVLDRSRHAHPPSVFYIYKLFILCKLTGKGELRPGSEIEDVAYFSPLALPTLSKGRITQEQIQLMVQLSQQENAAVLMD